jgi:ABC-type transport system substrate-binding protein
MPRRPSLPVRLITVLGAAFAVLGTLVVGGTPPATAAGQPLRYYADGPIGTLDPARISDAGDVQLLLQLYAGLTRMDEQGHPYPSLAQSWDVSTDGLTYTFHLRAGLEFSDGAPLQAGDVRRSWLRLLDPAVQSTSPDVLNIIVGAQDRLLGRIGDSGVGISAPDARTLVVNLRHPASYFPALIATPTTFVVPRSAAPSGTWQRVGGFVGSGPYVAAREASGTLVLLANPHYVLGAPPIGEVDWVTLLSSDPVTAYAQNQVDLTGVAPSDASWIAYDPTLGTALHRAADLSVQYLGFDTTRPPFNDVRVRKAFALALDRPRLVSLSAGDAAVAATSIVPPAIQPPGLPTGDAPAAAGARALLDAAGYTDRSKLGTITVNATGLDVSPIVATWRRELGVTVDVESMSFNDYITALDSGSTPQVFTINWIADYPSPHALYDLLLSPDARSNYGHWNDPTFVKLLDAAAAAPTDAARASAYAAVETEVDAQAPLIPWSYAESSWLVRPGLRGLGSLTIGLLDFGLASWG